MIVLQMTFYKYFSHRCLVFDRGLFLVKNKVNVEQINIDHDWIWRLVDGVIGYLFICLLVYLFMGL